MAEGGVASLPCTPKIDQQNKRAETKRQGKFHKARVENKRDILEEVRQEETMAKNLVSSTNERGARAREWPPDSKSGLTADTCRRPRATAALLFTAALSCASVCAALGGQLHGGRVLLQIAAPADSSRCASGACSALRSLFACASLPLFVCMRLISPHSLAPSQACASV